MKLCDLIKYCDKERGWLYMWDDVDYWHDIIFENILYGHMWT